MPDPDRRHDHDEPRTQHHRVEVHFQNFPPFGGDHASLDRKLDHILSALAASAVREKQMALDFTALTSAVSEMEGTVASGEKLLGDLGAEIARLAALVQAGDPTAAAQIADLGTKVSTLKSRLAQAIAANPVPGEVVPPPVDPPPSEFRGRSTR